MLRRFMCVAAMGMLVIGVAATPAAAGQPARARCISELRQVGLLGRAVNPGTANLITGTEGNDDFGTTSTSPGQLTDGVDVVCGFGGDDVILCCEQGLSSFFGNGDVFIGGDGSDHISYMNAGATFFGGAGADDVAFIFEGATYIAGPGDDSASFLEGGTYDGGDGADSLAFLNAGTFNGGTGNDSVVFLAGGTFNGGPGDDTVELELGGTFNQ